MRFILGCSLILVAHTVGAAEKLVLVAGTEQAPLKEPFGLDFTSDGKIVIAEYGAHRITQIDSSGKLTVLAGEGTKGDIDGPALKAKFNGPHNLVLAKNGDIYVADTFNHKVRKIDAKTGAVTTLAGTGKKGFSGDGGPATKAEFDQAYHVVLHPTGSSLFVVDLGNRRIRKIDLKSGIVTTVIGTGKRGIPEAGAKAIEAPLVDPRACAFDSKGRLYIVERSGHAMRVVEDGKIRTVAGTGKQGNTGDGGPALKATLNGPKNLWIDNSDDVLIADAENNVIRKYVPKDGTIVRVAGTGKKGASKLGAPLETQFFRPHGVGLGADRTFYIVDSENNRVLKVVKE